MTPGLWALPSRWQWSTLGELVGMSSGGTPSRKHPEYYGGSIPWVKIGDLTDGAVRTTEEFISEAGLANSAARVLPAGTLLVAMYGSIGKLGRLEVEAATNQAICALEGDDALLDYLYWYLRERRATLLGLGRGGTQDNISQTILRALPVPLPPPSELAAIADLARAQMESLALAKHQLLAALTKIAQYEMAVSRDAFSGKLIGVDEDAWPLYELRDLASAITSGSRDWKPYYDRGDGVFIMAQNIRPRRLDFSGTVFHVDPPAEDTARTRSAVQRDDVLVTIVGAGTGTVARVDTDLVDHWVCQSVALVRPKRPLTGRYLELYLNSPIGVADLRERAYGAGRPHLSFDDLRSLSFRVPDPDVQDTVVSVLDSHLAAARVLRHRIEAALRQADDVERAMLRKVVTGQVEITHDDAGAESDWTVHKAASVPSESSGPVVAVP